MTFNKQHFSMWVGILIVIFHIIMVLFLVFYFSDVPGSKLLEISIPITAAYISAIVLWMMNNNGIITLEDKFGLPMAVLIVLIVGGMIVAMALVPISFLLEDTMTVEKLNDRYLVIEGGFGAIFGLIMTYLFGHNKN